MGRLLPPRRLLLVVLLSIVPALQVYRFADFAARDGGIEHDSGWYLGVARNLAERGKYVSSSNIATTADPSTDGIHYWQTLQDEEGFTYFCPGVTVGPGFIVPEALVLKIFGVGWWQYRLFPLAVMLCLLVLLSLLAYARGGLIAVVLLQLWIWILPQVTFNYAYEAYSEDLALFYCLLAFCTYGYAVDSSRPRNSLGMATGFFLALAYLTKTLYLSSAAAVAVHLVWRIARRQLAVSQFRWIASPILLGFLVPTFAFEAYRFAVLVSQFGLDGYYANNVAAAMVFRIAGSGLSDSFLGYHGLLRAKFKLLENIGLLSPPLAWVFALTASGFALRSGRTSSSLPGEKGIQTVLAVIAIKATLVLVWFVLMTQSRFTRHAWDVLVVLMLLASIGTADALRCLWRHKGQEVVVAVLVLLLAIASAASFDFRSVEPRPWLAFDRVMAWYKPFQPPLQYVVFAPVFRKSAQEEVAQFLKRELREEDRVYYLDRQKVAELPPLVGTVFFPIQRYQADRPTFRGRSFAVLGPLQIGDWPWRIEEPSRIERLLQTYRKQIVFQNDLYVVLEEPFYDLADPPGR